MRKRTWPQEDGARVGGRLAGLDATRGCAVGAMLVYHLLFDLKFYFGLDALEGSDWAWRAGSTAITGAFLFCSGSAARCGDGGWNAEFFRRQAKLALAAGAVSLSTYFFVPDWWVRFGVLHCIFVSGFVCRVARRCPAASGAAGVAIAAAWAAGLLPELPQRTGVSTLDFVPIVPWLAVALCGVAGFPIFQSRHMAELGGRMPLARWMGRRSLAIYLLHQPLIIAGLAVGARMFS